MLRLWRCRFQLLSMFEMKINKEIKNKQLNFVAIGSWRVRSKCRVDNFTFFFRFCSLMRCLAKSCWLTDSLLRTKTACMQLNHKNFFNLTFFFNFINDNFMRFLAWKYVCDFLPIFILFRSPLLIKFIIFRFKLFYFQFSTFFHHKNMENSFFTPTLFWYSSRFFSCCYRIMTMLLILMLVMAFG